MKKLAGLLALPLLVACAGGSGAPTQSDVAIPSEITIPSAGADGVSPGMIDEVIAMAEEETGVDRSDIQVAVAEAVTWPDGSLGCPEEGMVYTQALVPGYRVVLDVAGEELAFHAAENGEFVACANPMEPVDGSPDN